MKYHDIFVIYDQHLSIAFEDLLASSMAPPLCHPGHWSCRIVLFMHIKVKEVVCIEASENPPKSDVKSQSGGRFQGNAEKP